MPNVKVERKGSYQGVPQWGITGDAQMTPSKKTAEKWAQAENNARRHRIQKRLEYLRAELRAERISYGELHELQTLAEHIDASDVELLEAAGVEEKQ